MAFYAELKRRHWYCINGVNAILWYRQKLYDDWWSSLSEEQKAQVEENRRKAAERRKKESEAALMRLLSFSTMIAGISERPSNKYGDLYNEFGFVNKK